MAPPSPEGERAVCFGALILFLSELFRYAVRRGKGRKHEFVGGSTKSCASDRTRLTAISENPEQKQYEDLRTIQRSALLVDTIHPLTTTGANAGNRIAAIRTTIPILFLDMFLLLLTTGRTKTLLHSRSFAMCGDARIAQVFFVNGLRELMSGGGVFTVSI